MPQLILVLVGAIGIGLGLGAALVVPKVANTPQEATVATALEEVSEAGEGGVMKDSRELYDVVKVIDGDTVTIKMGEKNETLRLIGIDTPETNDTRTGVQCFGAEATAYLKKIIGERVAIETDASQGERDKYKRLLVYLFAESGANVNKKLIADGYAYEYTYDDEYKYQDEFKAAETAAREEGKGLWAPDACPKPTTKSEVKKVTAPAVLPAVSAVPEASTTTASAAPPATAQEVKTEEPYVEPKPEPKPETKPETKSEPKPEPERVTAPASGEYTCSTNTYNCSHFKTQTEAQSVFEQCGGVDNDVHRLDGNKDGSVCESLP